MRDTVPHVVQYGKYQKCGTVEKIKAESSLGDLPVTFAGEIFGHKDQQRSVSGARWNVGFSLFVIFVRVRKLTPTYALARRTVTCPISH